MTITFETTDADGDADDFRLVRVDGIDVGTLTWWRGMDGALDAWYFEDGPSGTLEKVCSLSHSRSYAEGTLAHMLRQRIKGADS